MALIDLLVQEMDVYIRQHIGHVQVFAANTAQLEDWFRGELLVRLEALKPSRQVVRYGTPLVVLVNGAEKEVDVDVQDHSEHIAVELKAWFIGKQRRKTIQAYTPIGYLDPDPMGGDIEKLAHWRGPGRKGYVVGIAYPRPSQADWSKAVAELHRKFGAARYLGVTINDLTTYAQYPQEFMIGVLEVK